MTRLGDLEIDVLGPVRALRGGREISVGGPVDRAVLAALAIKAGERVAVSELLDVAYAGISKHSAKRALQTAIWRLRRSLHDDGSLIVTDRDGYRLAIDPAAVDAGALRLALATAALACRDSRPTDAVAVLSKAAARWRGRAPELPTSVTDPLEELVCDTIEGLAALLLDANRPDDALEHLRRLLAEHPGHPQAVLLADEATRRRGLLVVPVSTRDPSDRDADPPTVVEPGGSSAADEVSEPLRTIVRLVAVMGRCVPAELRAAVGRWFDAHEAAGPPATPEMVDALVEGVDAGLLSTPGSPAGDVRISSAEVAERILDDVDSSTVLAMNGVVANALLEVHGDDPGPHLLRRAEHLVRGIPMVDPPAAIDALRTAAEYAMISDPDAGLAVGLFERAIGLLEGWIPSDHECRIDLLLQLGRARERGGDSEGASDAWEKVTDLATVHDLPFYLAEAALELAGTIWNPRAYAGSTELLERAAAVLPPEADLRGLIVLRRVQMERHAPDDGWMEHTVSATDRLLLAGFPGEEKAARATLALAMWASAIEKGTGTFDHDPELERLVSAAAGDAPALTLMRDRWQITRAIVQGRWALAERLLADLAARLPGICATATTAMERDEFEVAGYTSALQLATVRMYQGRGAQAVAVIEAHHLAEAGTTPPTRTNMDERALIALHFARSGQRERAAAILSDVLADLWERPTGQVRYATAVNAAFVAADLATAGPMDLLLAELDPQRGRHCLIGQSGYAGVTEHALGRLHASKGDLEEADHLLRAAVSAHVRVGADVFASLSRYWRADVLQGLGGRSRSAEAADLLVEVERAHVRFRADTSAA